MAWLVKAAGSAGPPPGPMATPDFSKGPRCEHPVIEVRRDTHPKVGVRYRKQCTTCGAGFGMVSKSEVRDFLNLKPFDEELATAWRKKVSDYYDAARKAAEAEQGSHAARWWAWYDAYLRSPEWARLRGKVLTRDGGRCQGCLAASATQVHHLTYERVGNELLFDLIAVCDGCHKRLHPDRN